MLYTPSGDFGKAKLNIRVNLRDNPSISEGPFQNDDEICDFCVIFEVTSGSCKLVMRSFRENFDCFELVALTIAEIIQLIKHLSFETLNSGIVIGIAPDARFLKVVAEPLFDSYILSGVCSKPNHFGKLLQISFCHKKLLSMCEAQESFG